MSSSESEQTRAERVYHEALYIEDRAQKLTEVSAVNVFGGLLATICMREARRVGREIHPTHFVNVPRLEARLRTLSLILNALESETMLRPFSCPKTGRE